MLRNNCTSRSGSFFHALRQSLEHALALVDRIADHQDRLLCVRKQLADNDGRVAIGDAGASGPDVTRSIGGSVDRPSLRSVVEQLQTATIWSDVKLRAFKLGETGSDRSNQAGRRTRDNCNSEYGAAIRRDRSPAISA